MDSIIGSSYVKPTPVFSFHTIVDEDVSLLSYVIMNYYDESIFDFSNILSIDFTKVISMIYYRTVENPLRLFMVEGADEAFVDECYHEFLHEKEAEVLENGILTEIPDLIRVFEDTSGISPSIFYYNDDQLRVLESMEELEDIEKIKYTEVSNDKHTQIYINHYQEISHFQYLKGKTFYFASNQINVDILRNLDDYKELTVLAGNGNRISIYDLYNTDLVYKEGE